MIIITPVQVSKDTVRTIMFVRIAFRGMMIKVSIAVYPKKTSNFVYAVGEKIVKSFSKLTRKD